MASQEMTRRHISVLQVLVFAGIALTIGLYIPSVLAAYHLLHHACAGPTCWSN